ncbi:hypothetical protein LCGC14_1511880 [marine sediment metagenome]|uniref:Uncharacterized protein n=1 Tax=marine sediment metagenome TaxID=412755 RepID=A0A0F9LGP0_9ZZZZ
MKGQLRLVRWRVALFRWLLPVVTETGTEEEDKRRMQEAEARYQEWLKERQEIRGND